MSERRACRVLNQPRATQRYEPKIATDEAAMTKRIIELACEYGRYGYRRVTALLRQEGWQVNHKRVERIWRREGLKVPQKQPSPWENGYVESFNGKLRDELLNREIFYTLTEAKVLIERWRREYNTVRPHSSLGYRAPAAIEPFEPGSATLRPPQRAREQVQAVT